MAKNVKVRLQHKIDSAENWGKAAGFVPLTGELIIYSDGAGGEPIPRIKIGDGTTAVDTLDFADNHDLLSTVATSGKYEDLTDKPTTQFNLDDDGVLFVEMVTPVTGSITVIAYHNRESEGMEPYTTVYNDIPEGKTFKAWLGEDDTSSSGGYLWVAGPGEGSDAGKLLNGSYATVWFDEDHTQEVMGNDLIVLGHTYYAYGD